MQRKIFYEKGKVLRGIVCRLEECLSLIVFKAKHVRPKVGGSRGQNGTRQSGHLVALKREVRAVVSPGCSSLTPVYHEKQRGQGDCHTHTSCKPPLWLREKVP